MCGLFGAFAPSRPLTAADLDLLHDIAHRSQRRGRDASGLVIVDGRRDLVTAKADTGIARLLRDDVVADALKRATGAATAVFGHTRLATHGSIGVPKNNHPILSDRWAVVHNGWVTNHRTVVERFDASGGDRPDTDSYAINVVLEAWLESADEDLTSFVSALEGEFTFVAWSTRGDGVAYTNVGNLYTTAANEGGTAFVASEPAFFPAARRDGARQLELGRPLVLSQGGDDQMVVRQLPVGVRGRGVRDTSVQHPERVAQQLAELSRMHDAIAAWSAGFERCPRCVLPVRFPHFDADAAGVCTYCREYVPPSYGGMDSLREQIDRRLPAGSRQVLVGLSGGRDSCYSMHLVDELGYEPLAFTYDWGLVTNEARENMARMCGRLGVEHVLVARDIQEVKRRLRGGIAALLGTPDLAIVPLLMSGDKSWMHWAQRVARERGGIPIVMGTHRAETTGFKSALATGRRVRAHGEVEHFWKLQVGPLARMAARYLTFGIREPRAIPILAQDAIPGAWHYYIRKQDMVLPFDHVPWDGPVIERTITERYGWGFDSTTKWRAGDGTAVMYNLLYLAGLGFSELDTFLSNQIRSGDVTRDAAMEQITHRAPLDGQQLVEYLRFIEIDVERSLDGLLEVVGASEGARQWQR